MFIMKITSEEPNIHWPFLNVENKVVLDLGCGLFYSSQTSARYFLDRGAKSVIGVDLGKLPVDGCTIYFQKNISSSEDLQDLINTFCPEIIKCDIEGAEVYFEGIAELKGVTEFAVEYHDNDLKLLMERKIAEWGFIDSKVYKLFDENIDRIGVIYAWK